MKTPVKKRRIADETCLEMMRLRETGKTYKAIAKTLRVSEATVRGVVTGKLRPELTVQYQKARPSIEKRPTTAVPGAGELVSEAEPDAQPETARTTEDIRTAINAEKTYTLAEMRELCEIPHVGKWKEATLTQLKVLCFHVQDPLMFSWLSPERVEVDREASAALQPVSYTHLTLPTICSV